MTTYTNSLVVYSDGRLQKIQSGDTLSVDNLSVAGDLNVQGDIVSTGATNVLVSDNFIDLSSGYTNTATARAGGFTVNVKATDFSTETGTDFVAGVVATSAPRIVVADPTAFSAGDIIQVSGATIPSNNGLFIVAAVSGTNIDLYGVGGTAVPGYTLFCQNQLTASTGNTATLTKVDLSVVTVSDGVNIKDSSGAAIPVGALTTAYYAGATVSDFNGTGPGTGYDNATTVTLQDAYDASGTPATIQLAGGKNLNVDAPGVGNAAISLDANAGSNFSVTGANLTLSTITSGTLAATSAGVLTLTAAADLTLSGELVTIDTGVSGLEVNCTGDATVNAIGLILSATANSSFTADGANLTLRTVTSGALAVTSAGVMDIDATAALQINSSGGAISIGNDNVAQNLNLGTAGARTIAIGSASATAVNVDAVAVSVDATSASNFTVTGGNLTLSTATSGAVAVTSAGVMDLDAASALSINSTGGAINVGDDANAQAINVGTGAAARTITLGNATGATAIDVNAGTGGITVDTTSGGAISIDAVGARSNFTVTDERLDLKSEGNFATGTQVLVEATNSGGTSQVVMQAGSNVLMQVPAAAPTLYFLADADAGTPFVAMEADTNAAGIYIGSEPYNSFIAIGTDGSRNIDIGNTNSGTNIDLYAQAGITADAWMKVTQYLRPGQYAAVSFPAGLGAGEAGSLVYDTTNNVPMWFDGTNWRTFTSLSASTLQQAYEGGNTISLSATEGDLGISVGSGSAAVTIDTNKASWFKTTGAALSLQTITSGALDLTSAGVLDIDAASTLSINSSGAVINIGNDAVAQGINIGTGAAARTITVGNVTGATSLTVNTGTGGVDVNSAGNVTIDGTGISLDASLASNFTVDGADLTLSTFNSGTVFLSSAGAMNIDAIGAMSLNTTSGAINIGDGADNNPINIATGGSRQVTIGTTTSAPSGIDLLASELPINLTVVNESINLTTTSSGDIVANAVAQVRLDGGTGVEINSAAAAISIGNDADNFNISIGAGGTRAIQMGSTTASVVFGSSSSTQSAGGTYLPVGASSGIVKGEVLYINTGGEVAKADGDGTGTREVVGAALNTAGGGAGDLLVGTVPGSVIPVKFASPPSGSDVGKPVYLSTTAGQATPTAPVSGRVYRLGLLLSSTANGDGNYRVLWLPSFVADL